MMLSHPLAVILVVTLISFAYGADCPWDIDGLKPWSSLNAKPDETVIIDEGILYDVTSDDEYEKGLEIVAGGRLVFKPNVADGLLLKTNSIIIKKDGHMNIGAKEDECRYTGKLTIQLLGTRETIERIEEFGDKVIGVDEGGHLGIFGPKQPSWTKLGQTLPETPRDAFLYNETLTNDDKVKGFIVYQFDPAKDEYEKEDVKKKEFFFKTDRESKFKKSVQELNDTLTNIPHGHIGLAVIRKSMISKTEKGDLASLNAVIADFLEIDDETKTEFSKLEFYDGYVMIKKQGYKDVMVEQASDYRVDSVDQVSEAYIYDSNKKFYAKSYTRIKNHSKSSTTVEVIKQSFSEPTIELADDISSWKEGSEILITSTAKPDEHEIARITKIIDSTHVKTDLTVRHRHLCETYKGIPVCAEVALLDRDVRVEGVTFGEDQHGGNIKCLKKFGSCHFADFGLILMGSHFPLGRYPIHFHLAEDVAARASVDGVSIRNTYARCVVAHFTHNLVVKNSVCYDSLGHGFFLEDGVEVGNVFEHNLAVAQRKAGLPNKEHLIKTDSEPCGFFITNPDNEFVGNIAVEAEGHGFRFAIPTSPMGLSADLSDLEEREALRTNLKLFKNNTARANKGVGVIVGDVLNPKDGSIKWSKVGFAPREDVNDEKSDLETLEISCINSFSNGEANVRIRAAKLSASHLKVGNSSTGIELTRSVRNEVYEQEIKDCIILGDRKDGQEEGDIEDDEPRVGLSFVGPLKMSRMYFDDFYRSENYHSGALGFAGGNLEAITGNTMGKDIFFGFDDPEDGNRMLSADAINEKKGNLVETIVIEDGKVTGTGTPTTVLRNTNFQVTENCKNVSDTYAICEEKYAMVDTNRPADIIRVNTDGSREELKEQAKNTKANVIANNEDYNYLISYNNFPFDKSVVVRTFDPNEEKEFVMGFCVPRGEDVEPQIKYSDDSETFETTDDFEDLRGNDGMHYFHNKSIGVVFVNLVGQTDDEPYCEDEYEKKGICRTLVVRVKTDNPEINDCVSAAIDTHLTSPPETRQLIKQQKERKTILTKAEKRILELIQKLEDAQDQPNHAKRIAKRQTRRRKRSLDLDLSANIDNMPDDIGVCDDDSEEK